MPDEYGVRTVPELDRSVNNAEERLDLLEHTIKTLEYEIEDLKNAATGQ